MLSQKEHQQITEVIAKDLMMQENSLLYIRNQECCLKAGWRKRDVILESQGSAKGEVCLCCCAAFNLLRWALECSRCKNKICRKCSASDKEEKNQKILCNLCELEKELTTKKLGWYKMYPYNSGSFGYKKLLAKLPDHFKHYGGFLKWKLLSTLEQLVSSKLDISLNESNLEHCYEDSTVGLFKQRISAAILEIISKSYSCDQIVKLLSKHEFIFEQAKHAFADLITAENAFRRKFYSKVSEDRSYDELLSAAIIVQLIQNCVSANGMHGGRRSSSVATQTGHRFELRENDNSISNEVSSSIDSTVAEFIQNRSYPFPIMESYADNDSALETEEADVFSMHSSTAGPNWFFKACDYGSPCSSVRQTKLLPSLQSLPNLFEQKIMNDTVPVADFVNHFESINKPCLNVEMLTPHLECFSGENVKVFCRIQNQNYISQNIEVSWYISDKELINDYRHRMCQSKDIHSLEIYDVDAADAGEIVCLAVDDFNISSAVAMITVAEQEVDGEVPKFTNIHSNQYKCCVGDHVMFSVQLSGYPQPKVNFYFATEDLSFSERHKIDTDDNGIWTLRIHSSKASDKGEYVVTAENRFGKDELLIELIILNRSHKSVANLFDLVNT